MELLGAIFKLLRLLQIGGFYQGKAMDVLGRFSGWGEDAEALLFALDESAAAQQEIQGRYLEP